MPRADDPRIMVRLTPEDHATIKAAADLGNIALSALVRECAIRYASTVAADVRQSGHRMRRAHAVEAVKGQVVTARSLVVESEADRLRREHQERINESTARARSGVQAVRRQVP